jgi:hypothetical protein
VWRSGFFTAGLTLALLLFGALDGCLLTDVSGEPSPSEVAACGPENPCTSSGSEGGTSGGGEGGASSAGEGGDAGAASGGEGGALWCPTTNPFPPHLSDSIIDCFGVVEAGTACGFDGANCKGLRCGTAGAGSRHCHCYATGWTCTDCDFSYVPWWSENLLNEVEPCAAGIADEVACETENEVCASTNDEACVCYVDPNAGLVWDCGSVERCQPGQ